MADHYKEWYDLYHDEGLTQSQIAEKFDVTQGTVSNGISTYEKGLEDGKDNATPDIFETDELRSELESRDTKDEEDSYDCAECGSKVDYGTNPCPECGATLNWSGVE